MEKIKYFENNKLLNFIEKSRSEKVARVEKIVNNWMRNFGGLNLDTCEAPKMDSSYVPMEIYHSSNNKYSDVPMQIFRNNPSYDVPFEIEDRRNFRD